MGLLEQHQAFKFAGGVETKMDPKAVPPVRLLALENGVFSRAISIKKRNGYQPQSRAVDGTTSLITGAKRFAKRGDELLLFTNNNCYSKQSSNTRWVDAGAVIAPLGYDRPAVHTGTAQTAPDHATSNGVTVYAWEDSLGGVWWTAVDAESGRVYRAPTQADANGQRPRCVPVGDVLHIYYAVPAQRVISCVIVNPSTPSAAASPQVVVEDLDTTNPVYDACPTERDGTPACIAWHEHATTNVRVGYVTAGGVLGGPATGLPSVYRDTSTLLSGSPLGVAYRNVDGGDDDRILLAYVTADPFGVILVLSGGTSSSAITYQIGLVPYTAPVDVQRVAITETSGVAWLVFEEDAAEPSNHYCVVNSVVLDESAASTIPTFGSGAGLWDVGTERTIRSVCLASRAFHAGADGDAFAAFIHDTTYFNTYMTLRLADFAPAGRHLPGSADAPQRSHVSSVHVVDDVATVTLPYKARLESENNDKFAETGIRRIVMDFDSEDSHQYAQLGTGVYLGGACPLHYDGRVWTEQGFNVGPELMSGVPASGGSMTTGSVYKYKAWYEWTDGQGDIHRGPESVGLEITTGGSDTQVTLTLPMLRITKKDNVRICVARSLPGDSNRFWRVSSLDPTMDGAINGYIANDPTVDSATFIDRMSDVDLQLEEQVYTVGGILSNDPCPLGSHVTAGKNRLFYTDAQDGNIVRFSQKVVSGFGAECAPELMLDIPPEGGDVTGLAVMDDIVFVFKANAVYAFNGDGPYSDGSNAQGGLVSGFSPPQKLPGAAVGCTDPNSIVVTPQGIMFRSGEQGIWSIGLDRQLKYTGSPVEAYNAQNVRRATALPDRTAVLFLTDSGKSLYYDYLFEQWSTFTNHEGYDAAVVAGSFYYLRTNDIVFKETPGEYRDGTSRITLRFETAWLHMQEHLQGFERFWKLLLLGTWSSPHQLAVQYRLSYDEAWSDPYYLDATGDTDAAGWITGDSANTIGEDPILGSNYGDGNYGDGVYGGTGPQIYQWRYGIHENGQSVQFRFEDFEKAGLSGASFELTEMTIVGGVMKPDNRPFAASRSV